MIINVLFRGFFYSYYLGIDKLSQIEKKILEGSSMENIREKWIEWLGNEEKFFEEVSKILIFYYKINRKISIINK